MQDLDSLLKQHEKGNLSTEDRLRLEHHLASQALPEGVLAPITLGVPTSLPPVAYVVHVWTKICQTCGARHRHAEVFAENMLRTAAFGASRYVRNMTPVSRPEWNVPLRTHRLAAKPIPFCHHCLDLARDHLDMLPKPPAPLAQTNPLAGTRTAEGVTPPTAPGGSAPKAKRNTPFTTDDLLNI